MGGERIAVGGLCLPLLFAALTGRSGHGLAHCPADLVRESRPVRSASAQAGTSSNVASRASTRPYHFIRIVAGVGPAGEHVDAFARHLAQESGGHLGSPGVVHAQEQHAGTVEGADLEAGQRQQAVLSMRADS